MTLEVEGVVDGGARLLRCGRDRSGGGFPSAGYEPVSRHAAIVPSPLGAGQKERPKYPEKSLPDNNSRADEGNASGTALYRGSGESPGGIAPPGARR